VNRVLLIGGGLLGAGLLIVGLIKPDVGSASEVVSVPAPVFVSAPAAPLPTIQELRAAHPTTLRIHEPSPQAPGVLTETDGNRVLSYPSGSLWLKGLFRKASSQALARGGKFPVLVYLHGGFALDATDVDVCAPFIAAGFSVWAPSYRGEDGNPGDFELFFGELDDARAAIDMAGRLPDADPERVVVFGHSAGGILAALTALYADLPARYTGSAGGLNDTRFFSGMQLPFDDSVQERLMRSFAPFVTQLQKPHFACAGTSDRGARSVIDPLMARHDLAGVPLEVLLVPGDHFTSLPACMSEFLSRVQRALN